MKCDGCGAINPLEPFTTVYVTNGALCLCRQCLSDVNRKNPELQQLKCELVAARDHARGDYWQYQGDGEDHPESLVCPVLMTADQFRELMAERDKLLAFKQWVHNYLDGKGVPKEFPDGEHTKCGCRIGDRMNWVFEQTHVLRVDSDNYRGKCDECGLELMFMLTDSYCSECTAKNLQAQITKMRAAWRQFPGKGASDCPWDTWIGMMNETFKEQPR